jgi:hypothetical protein
MVIKSQKLSTISHTADKSSLVGFISTKIHFIYSVNARFLQNLNLKAKLEFTPLFHFFMSSYNAIIVCHLNLLS